MSIACPRPQNVHVSALIVVKKAARDCSVWLDILAILTIRDGWEASRYRHKRWDHAGFWQDGWVGGRAVEVRAWEKFGHRGGRIARIGIRALRCDFGLSSLICCYACMTCRRMAHDLLNGISMCWNSCGLKG